MNTAPGNVGLLMSRAAKLKQRATKEELHIRDMLTAMGIRFIFQKCFCASRTGFIVDFYFPKPHRLCLEIDGGHHSVEPQLGRDRVRDEYLKRERGMRVIRLTNAEAMSISGEELKVLCGFKKAETEPLLLE